MSHYRAYLEERTNDHILETEDGFITWRDLNDKQVYIVDIYVRPEARKKWVATRLAESVIHDAKLQGKTEVFGTVVPSTKGSDTSLRVLIAFGMKLVSAANDLIIMKKDI